MRVGNSEFLILNSQFRMTEFLIHPFGLGGHLRGAVVTPDSLGGSAAERLRALAIDEQFMDRTSDRLRVTGRHEDAAARSRHDLRKSASSRLHDGNSTGHGLEH